MFLNEAINSQPLLQGGNECYLVKVYGLERKKKKSDG